MKLYVEIPRSSGYGTTFRDATEEEATEALEYQELRRQLHATIEQAKEDLEDLINKATEDELVNKVFYDSPGFEYDVRHFIATGDSSLI